MKTADNCLVFTYKGHSYQMRVAGARIVRSGDDFVILADNGKIILYPIALP